jgi:MYXO-CTERM domain-containing protein
MLALEGGAKNAQGDRRCTPNGIPADAAYIQVDLPDQPRGSWLYLEVRATAPQSPIVRLRQLYDGWRANHACASGGSGGAGGNGGAGATPGTCSIGRSESSADDAAWIALALGGLAALRIKRRRRAARV